MNKNDKIMIFSILFILLVIIIFQYIFNNNDNKIAYVYYENEIILTVDLSKKEKQEFIVKGYNGDVHIIALDGKIKVDEEKSPNHLCSKQGYISSSYETIVCLPNKIVIKIEADDSVDTILR